MEKVRSFLSTLWPHRRTTALPLTSRQHASKLGDEVGQQSHHISANQLDLLKHYILNQERERARITKDLQDNIGSKLSALNIHLHQLSQRLPQVQDYLIPLMAALDEMMHTTSKISNELLPPTLDNFGLAYAVEELADSIKEREGLNVYVQIDGDVPAQRDKITELNLYRILQELIANALTHGDPTEIQIGFWQFKDQCALAYFENGKGFDMKAKGFQRGHGLADIESRLQMIRGKYEFYSVPNEGIKFHVKASLFPDYFPQTSNL
ncbi:MAG: ATP-binding protein [Bacteroidota bacterium]